MHDSTSIYPSHYMGRLSLDKGRDPHYNVLTNVGIYNDN